MDILDIETLSLLALGGEYSFSPILENPTPRALKAEAIHHFEYIVRRAQGVPRGGFDGPLNDAADFLLAEVYLSGTPQGFNGWYDEYNKLMNGEPTTLRPEFVNQLVLWVHTLKEQL